MRADLTIVASACAILGSQSASGQELLYHLPKGTAAAGWQARLLACPVGGKAEIAAQSAIIAAYGKGELVRINSTSPFLASRSVALTFHENGTLKTVNAEGEGKGGAFVASVLKSAAGLISLGPVAGVAAFVDLDGSTKAGDPPSTLACKAAIKRDLDEYEALKLNVVKFEARIAAGPALGAFEQGLYEKQKSRLVELEKALTLSTSVKLEVEGPADLTKFIRETNPKTSKIEYVLHGWAKPLDLSKWFDGGPAPIQERGQNGFCVRFAIAQDALDASQPTAHFDWRTWRNRSVENNRLARRMTDRFVYLRPVTVEASIREAQDGDEATAAISCARKSGPLKLIDSKSLNVPQLSGYFILPLGAGAFESKASAAEFAADGRLVSISHKSTGAGQGIADGLAGALAAAETMRDGETKAIQRRVDRIKAENELDQLLTASDESSVETVPTP
ncbi:MAG: hypothetical protein EOP58_06945 [Sphingomonadales bacterium]|nr:MAG: hypothetical protein EOP58_06945 [Sphingomonadales bacterium]